jgi:phosphate transport system substrate-binding protein
MKHTYLKHVAVAGFALTAFTGAAQARDQVDIVGSSTVYPFSTVVAEQFGKTSSFKTPKVESTGSGGGLKLFCAGVGVGTPDITNASRRIKNSEVERCHKNGVAEIIEVKIGYDGIVLANSKKTPAAEFTLRQIFLALAKQVPEGGAEGGKLIPNPFKKWSDIDPSLPNIAIEVMGPPPTSGTRDAFNELAIEGGCKTFKHLKAVKKMDKKKYKAICRGIRTDGPYIEAGENDNLIVSKLEANPNAFGVFGYSYLDQNIDKIQGSKIKGTAPTFDNIADGSYPVSRPLFFYVKKAHVGSIPGIKEYVAEFTSEKAWGPNGYLSDRGLIPMPKAERAKFREDAAHLNNLMM